MILVLPITTDTAQLAIRSLTWAVHLIGKFDADLLIVARGNDSASAANVQEALRPVFQSVGFLPTNQYTLDNQFSDVLGYLKRSESKESWFWWQSDWTLLRPDAWPLILANCIRSDLKIGQPQSLKEFMAREIFHTGEPDFRIPIHIGNANLIEQLSAERRSTTVNVPQHTNPMTYYEAQKEVPPGETDIIYVTFSKDYPWLEFSLRSVRKFATGFRKVIVAVPEDDANELKNMIALWGFKVEVWPYADAPKGKGFLMHATKICQADLISDASFFCHLDSDCILREPNDAGHYFQDGKPVLVWKPYEALKGPKLSGVVSDCHQWGAVSEQTLGMKIHAYTMLRHPHLYPREIYKPFRERVEEVHGIPFVEYVLKQRNSHPQTYAEHPSLGGFCYERFRHLFHWVNAEEHAPRDLMKAFWSHESPDQWIGNGWHDGKAVVPNAEKKMTARMLIESWLT